VTESTQQLYSIKDLENFTQIKAHTIRIWEQRYNLFDPERTDSNIRLYDDSDLKKLLNIKLLNSHGLKISKIGSLSEEEIIVKAKKIIENSGDQTQNKWTNELIIMILNFEGAKISKFLKRELRKSDMMTMYTHRILPLMHTLGELWQVNSIGIAHEHYFSNLYREFIISQIAKIKPLKLQEKKAVLFLHSEEEHEFSILMYYYLLKKLGFDCHYFGQKTPTSEIEQFEKQLKPDLVVTTFTAKISEKSFHKILEVLTRISTSSKVVISGSQLGKMNLSLPKNINFIKTASEFYQVLGVKPLGSS